MEVKEAKIKIAKFYIEEAQKTAILEIKVDAGYWNYNNDLKINKIFLEKFTEHAIKVVGLSDFVKAVDKFFSEYVELSRTYIHSKELNKASNNFKKLKSLDVTEILKNLNFENYLKEE